MQIICLQQVSVFHLVKDLKKHYLMAFTEDIFNSLIDVDGEDFDPFALNNKAMANLETGQHKKN